MEETYVINTVTHHNKSVKTDVNVEARVLVGIKSCRTQNVGVRRAAGHNFDPTYVLTNAATLAAANETAHINFKSGFYKGEEARSHTYGNILTEYLGKNALDHNLTSGIGEILIDDKSFVLEECALVACVGGFVSVNSAGVNKTVGGLVCLHIAHTVTR